MNGVTSFGDAIQCPEINTSTFLKKGTDIDMRGQKIKHVANATDNNDAFNKGLIHEIIKGFSFLKEGKLDTKVSQTPSSQGSRTVQTYIYNIAFFNKLAYKQENSKCESISFSMINTWRPPGETCYYPQSVIPISLFIKSDQFLVRSAGTPVIKWLQELFLNRRWRNLLSRHITFA